MFEVAKARTEEMAVGSNSEYRGGECPMQSLGHHMERTDIVPLFWLGLPITEKSAGTRMGPWLQGLSSALYRLRTKHLMEPSPGETKGTETIWHSPPSNQGTNNITGATKQTVAISIKTLLVSLLEWQHRGGWKDKFYTLKDRIVSWGEEKFPLTVPQK